MKIGKILQSAGILSLSALIVAATPASAGRFDDRQDMRNDRWESHMEVVSVRPVDLSERFENHVENDADMDDDHDGSHGDGGHAETVEAAQPVPTIDVVVHEDPKAGYNIEIITKNYTFTPANASTEHVANEGHSHIYIDGVKLTRVYGNWFYLKAFDEPGHHSLRVELSANDHRAYAHNGVIIDDTEMIMVQ